MTEAGLTIMPLSDAERVCAEINAQDHLYRTRVVPMPEGYVGPTDEPYGYFVYDLLDANARQAVEGL